jgi:glyoxylase-like metal-dependent hydrolase (beta-lactamase superfamily II)
MRSFDRRRVLAGALAAATGFATEPVHSKAPHAKTQAAGIYRYRLGDLELTAISDGVWHRPVGPDFVRNANFADVRRAMAAAYMPAGDRLPLPFTALLVNTGRRLVLIDAGSGGQIAPTAGLLPANLRAAGIDPKAIDIILISHFHPDHISGLKTKDNARVFPNAEIKVAAPEWAYWMDDANLRAAPDTAKTQFLNARRIFRDIAKDVARFAPGSEVAPGITSIAAYGHTPGHTVFAVSSGGDSVLVLGDTTNHPALFVRHPQWQGQFDIDGTLAAETRMMLLNRAAADRMLVAGFHFPFPACGHVVRDGNGFALVPRQWQPNL